MCGGLNAGGCGHKPRGYGVAAHPLPWTEEDQLLAPSGAATDRFGRAVAISGDTIVVGAPFDDDDGLDSGAAYVFVRSGSSWSHQQTLTSTTLNPGDDFGKSVAISGDTIVVGAPDDPDSGFGNPGAAYVFVRSGSNWTEEAKLVASDATTSDSFGDSVAISGDTIVVGASWGDNLGARTGSAYVFVRSGSVWTEQQKLTASDAEISDFFGASVAVSGDSAIIGAKGVSYAPSNGPAGAAYVFVRSGSTWTEQQKLAASNLYAKPSVFLNSSAEFGHSVAIDGDQAIVGARFCRFSTSGSGPGCAYSFTRSGSTWTENEILTGSTSANGDQTGYSVSLDGDTCVLGAPEADDIASSAGSAWVFVL